MRKGRSIITSVIVVLRAVGSTDAIVTASSATASSASVVAAVGSNAL